MTQDEIVKMAREAGIKNDCDGIWCDADQLIAFAALVRADEREACAKAAEAWPFSTPEQIAAAIRARGNK